MCVISLYDDKKKIPTLEELKEMQKIHGHGGGLAWIKDNKVFYTKGINLDSKAMMKIIKDENIKPPFVIHFRIKSSGNICKSNECNFRRENKNHNCSCHGFLIDQNGLNDQSGSTEKGILFHNGTCNEDLLDLDIKNICLMKGIKKPKFVSDSHKVAFLVAHHTDQYIIDWIENTEKFAILTPKGLNYYNGFERDSNNSLVSNTWHDDTYNKYSFNNNRFFRNKSKCENNKDCIDHDYTFNECLIEDDGKYYKVDEHGNYRDLDSYDDEYFLYNDDYNDFVSRRYEK